MIGLGVMPPFYCYVGKDMMSDLKYPHKSSTVPFWAVPVVAVLLPIVIFVAFYFQRRDVYDLHHAVLGILFSVLITGVLTNAIKDAVGRPRPDFFWRCFPDGKELYDQVTGKVICYGEKSLMNAGHKSFPSGHTSWSFAGLTFLALYLSGKIKVFDCRGHVAKLCIVFLPLLIASLVGISRVDDYRHHWQDVFAGGVLGTVAATFCYLQFFPPPHDINGSCIFPYVGVPSEVRIFPAPAISKLKREIVLDHQEFATMGLTRVIETMLDHLEFDTMEETWMIWNLLGCNAVDDLFNSSCECTGSY